MSLLHELNHRYAALHRAKEDAFWAQKMGLGGYAPGDFERKEIELKRFNSDPANLARVRAELERSDLTDEERIGLEGWRHFFEVNLIEGEEAQGISDHLIEMEGQLDGFRRSMPLGYVDPKTGRLVRASSVELTLLMQTDKDEAIRKAAWEGLRSIEPFVLDHGFIEIVRERNRLGRLLGYEDYYDYKVSVSEGFSKRVLFELLDDLEANTREACRASIESLVAERGESAAEPWNFEFHTTGDVAALVDPYFRFDTALGRWGVSFSAMGIRYRGARLMLDLVDRQGKHDNGFMHGPDPTWTESGRFIPARINFTANAVPGQIGSGRSAVRTLLHEGGHAAHFSNIEMPAPCFSQEFAPSSVAFAETQSMFLDSLMGDADWLTRYATNEAGESIPFELITRLIEKDHRFRAHLLRKMLAVSYAEKAIYEMTEEDLTPEHILATLRDVERRLLFQPAASRPLLAIPHLLAGEASAYYHGYTLAQMAVYQTRAWFLRTDGRIMDNPNVGRALREHYWKPGNSKTFLDMVRDLTGEPFSAKATVELVNRSLDEVNALAAEAVKRERETPRPEGPVELDAQITIVHGDEVIASTDDGDDFEAIAAKFSTWIKSLEEESTEPAGEEGRN